MASKEEKRRAALTAATERVQRQTEGQRRAEAARAAGNRVEGVNETVKGNVQDPGRS